MPDYYLFQRDSVYLISSCLVGINCKYNGSNTCNEKLHTLMLSGQAIPVCPEVLGGLSIPREPCEIVGEKVAGKSGQDYTRQFQDGADKTLQICRTLGISIAILQSRSPSCGYGKIYDGTFSGSFVEGNGITADLLSKNGILVYTESNWNEITKK